MADSERELALRISADASQAKAELDSLKTSTDGVAESTTGIAGASADAQAAIKAMDVAIAAGGKDAVAAFDAAELAVERLRGRVELAQRGGGPIPPDAIATMDTYREKIYFSRDAAEAAQASYDKLNPVILQNADAHVRAYTEAERLTVAARAEAVATDQVAVSAGLSATQLKSLGEGAGLSSAQLKSLGEQTGFTAAQSAQLTAGASSLEAALTQEGVAARATAGGLTAAAVGAVEVTAAQTGVAASATAVVVQENAIVLALQEARASFAALATAGVVGSAEWTAAMGRTAIAVATVNAEVAISRATGGIVTGAQLSGAELYTTKLATMVPALGAVGVATASTTAQKRLLSAATTQAANAMAGGTVSVGALGGSLLRILGPVGLAATAIALLPGALEAADEGSKKLGKTIDDLRHGVDDSTFAVQKSGESMEDYEARVARARDTREAMIRGFTAMGAGIIKESSDLNVAAAAWEIYNATKHNAIEGNEAFARSARAMGISLIEGFESADVKVQAFFRIYDEYLGTRGPFVAQRFADENKKFLDSSIMKFEEFGKTVPPRLKMVMEGLEALHERQAKAGGSAHVLADAEGRLAGAMAGVGIDAATAGMESYGATLSNIASKSIPEIITGHHSMLATMEAIRAKAVEIDLATTSAFRTGGSSQLSSGPTSGGHTSVGEPS